MAEGVEAKLKTKTKNKKKPTARSLATVFALTREQELPL